MWVIWAVALFVCFWYDLRVCFEIEGLGTFFTASSSFKVSVEEMPYQYHHSTRTTTKKQNKKRLWMKVLLICFKLCGSYMSRVFDCLQCHLCAVSFAFVCARLYVSALWSCFCLCYVVCVCVPCNNLMCVPCRLCGIWMCHTVLECPGNCDCVCSVIYMYLLMCHVRQVCHNVSVLWCVVVFV